MISRLQDLQTCLPIEYRSDRVMENKLLHATVRIEECRLVQQKVASNVEGVLPTFVTSFLQILLQIMKTNRMLYLTALFTNRRRFDRSNRRFNKGGRQWKKGKADEKWNALRMVIHHRKH